jgi:type VI secretion system protein ImpJ
MSVNSSNKVAIPTEALMWHDGLLLAPLHFQTLTRRQEELVTYHVRSAAPYAWGVRELTLAVDGLTETGLSVARLEAVMPDGLLVTRDDAHAPLTLKLSDAVIEHLRAPGARCVIHLVVPCGTADGMRLQPFVPNMAPHTGELPQVALSVGRPKASLVADLDLLPGAQVSLPLLQLKFENQLLEVTPYLPPLLDIHLAPLNGSPTLCQRAKELYQRLDNTALQLAAVAAECGDRLRSLELREKLRCVACAMPLLDGTLGLQRATPVQLYLALCSVLGSVAMLRKLSEAAPRAPVYEHENPGKTFDVLFASIEAHIDTVKRRYTEQAFERTAQGFSLFLGRDMLPGWSASSLLANGGAPLQVLLVGLRGITPEQAEQWMAGAIICSGSQLDDVRERRVRGAQRYRIHADGGLVLLAAQPDPLSAAPGYQIDTEGLRTAGTALFAIVPDWALVRAGQTLILETAGGAMPDTAVLLVAAKSTP